MGETEGGDRRQWPKLRETHILLPLAWIWPTRWGGVGWESDAPSNLRQRQSPRFASVYSSIIAGTYWTSSWANWWIYFPPKKIPPSQFTSPKNTKNSSQAAENRITKLQLGEIKQVGINVASTTFPSHSYLNWKLHRATIYFLNTHCHAGNIQTNHTTTVFFSRQGKMLSRSSVFQ